MKKRLKNKKGITLVALIITIIILLILATVSINLIINTGLIEKTDLARNKYSKEQEKEYISLGFSKYQMEKYSQSKPTLSVENAETEGEESTGWMVTFTDSRNIYGLSSDGSISELFDARVWDEVAEDESFFVWENEYTISGIKGADENNDKLCNGGDATKYKSTISNLRIPSKCKVFKGTTNLPNADFSSRNSIEVPYALTEIGESAFKTFTSVQDVTIPANVSHIGDNAFSGCTNLSNFNIEGNIQTVGEAAFENTAWYNSQADGIVLVQNVLYKYKGDMPSNTELVLDNGIISIAKNAFKGTNLKAITIPDSVKDVGYPPFYLCSNLESINVSSGNAWYSSENDILYNKDKTILLRCPSSIKSNISISSNTHTLNSYSFSEIEAEEVIIPNNIVTIKDYAFASDFIIAPKWIRKIFIPASVLNMGSKVFQYWGNKQTINVEFQKNNLPDTWKSDWNADCMDTIINYGYTRH